MLGGLESLSNEVTRPRASPRRFLVPSRAGRFVASSLGCREASGNRTKVHFPFHVSFEQYSDAYFSVLE
jgi:hypothetical protein